MQDATVYVDVKLTNELETEGWTREIIRRIQEMRRQLDLAVEDFISVEISVKDNRVYSLLNKEKIGLKIVSDFIAKEVRAKASHGQGIGLSFVKPGDKIRKHQNIKDWDVEGVGMIIGISRT